MRILVLAFALAGCASPGPMHGVAAFTLQAPGTDGRVAAPGVVHSTDGRPLSAGAGLTLDLLPETWILSFRADGTALPDDLEPARARAAVLDSWELAAGPKILESGGVRLDALAGARAWLLRVADADTGLPADDLEREAWVGPGLRAGGPGEASPADPGDTGPRIGGDRSASVRRGGSGF
jgi:hypothetical protein